MLPPRLTAWTLLVSLGLAVLGSARTPASAPVLWGPPVLCHPIAFAEGEHIHTENSHKYTVEGFQALAADAGFDPTAVWLNAGSLFSVHYMSAG